MNTIKIGLHKIRIVERSQDELRDNANGKHNDMYHGYYRREDNGDPVIYIEETLRGVERDSIICHEFIEAVNDLYGIELKHMQISVLGEVLTYLMKGSFGR